MWVSRSLTKTSFISSQIREGFLVFEIYTTAGSLIMISRISTLYGSDQIRLEAVHLVSYITFALNHSNAS